MYSKKLALWLSVFFSLTTFAQNSKQIIINPHWVKDEAFKYKVVKTYSKYAGEKFVGKDSINYNAVLKVLDFKDKIYLLSWSTNLKNTDLIQKFAIDAKYVSKIQSINIPTLNFAIDEKGEHLRVINWKDVGELVSKTFEEVLSSIKTNKDGVNLAKAAGLAQIVSALKTEKGVLNILADELNYMHNYYNKTLSVNNLRKYSDKIPNVFGNASVIMDGVTTVSNIDTVTKECKLSNAITINQASAKVIIEDLHKRNDKAAKELKAPAKPVKYDYTKDKLEITDVALLNFDYKKGVVKSMDSERKSDIYLMKLQEKRQEKISLLLIN